MVAISGPWDWSPFSPVANQSSTALTFATRAGMEQFGCCPKTAGDGSRRVLFGWLNNGWDQGPGEPDRKTYSYNNNTLSLPRDLSLSARGYMQQRFVPELASLRLSEGHVHIGSQQMPVAAVGHAVTVQGASGLQIEILACFSCNTTLAPAGRFGIMVLAATDRSEYTAITVDISREQLQLDRSHSGLMWDEDIRAGPLAMGPEFTLHAFVDHAVVEVIANPVGQSAASIDSGASTAIAVWVSPNSANSNDVALFSDTEGITLVSLDVWQLASPKITSNAPLSV